MTVGVNAIYCMDAIELLKSIGDQAVDLIVLDPPYFKVVSEKWDYQWKTIEDYVAWMTVVVSEASRVARIGGTAYLFGYYDALARLIPTLERAGFELIQQIVVDKGMKAVSGRATMNYKMFPNVTESVLFLVRDNKKFLKPFLKEHQQKIGLSSKEMNRVLGTSETGGGMWSIYTGKNMCEQFPTKEMWEKLRSALKFDLPYEKVAQTFNAQMGFTNVWSDVDFYEEERQHRTQKPLKLIKRLVIASSNEGNLVVDPFAGSGSTAVACKELGRNYICGDIDAECAKIATKRVEKTGKKKTDISKYFACRSTPNRG